MPKGHYVRTKFKPIAERLAAKTEKTDTCWLWRGTTGDFGHGQIMCDRNQSEHRYLRSTHRVAWELAYGPIPDGLCVLHKCDVPNCVRPSHLFLGTKADNTRDMKSKGRMKRGGQLPHAKVTASQVMEIRRSNGTQRELAERYGVSQATISQIRAGKSWSYLPPY